MTKQVLALDGSEQKTIELSDDVFDCEVSEGSIYHAIRNELANSRTGTASTKTRGEVRGSHRKPWRQKGTGRARAGRRRSPIWVGGGITFGPRPRSFSYNLPKKAKRAAMRSILTLKTRDEKLKIIQDFDVESGKTRDLVKIRKNIVPSERTVLILGGEAKLIRRAGANIPWLSVFNYGRLRAHDLFYGKNLVVQETAAVKLGEMYSKEKGNGK